ncbi:MAG: AAA family ATPase [Spirochaetaceae bacterium]|nr:AAA family ATPase [Spirochaetaceae bacterium]MBP3450274.1 AAA family ATPase [Spirochaetaceae bacterium]MBQ3025731.1 AAA family ATPase [Spirochaetaceae bacterium]MBQ7904864.1 AAA family ATPase [Spirochaetaceae bacterium]
MSDSNQLQQDCLWCRNIIEDCKKEVGKRIIGQTQIFDGIFTAMITGGNILLEGVPGLAKTLAVKTFADISGLSFKRIQFTPDLLPADITGTMLYNQSESSFSVRKGPIFTNIVLADEINRSPAKVQSALLEAMAEHQVTIGEQTYQLPEPFLVLATQNPIEQEGTYNLPEAELDRFLLKVKVPYPMPNEEVKIVKAGGNPENIPVRQILDKETLYKCKNLVDSIVCDDRIIEYIVSIISVTRPEIAGAQKGNDILRYISYGASPRASIALAKCAKAHALFQGRTFVLPEDVKVTAPSVLRHRLVLSYEAGADGVTADELIDKIISFIPVP